MAHEFSGIAGVDLRGRRPRSGQGRWITRAFLAYLGILIAAWASFGLVAGGDGPGTFDGWLIVGAIAWWGVFLGAAVWIPSFIAICVLSSLRMRRQGWRFFVVAGPLMAAIGVVGTFVVLGSAAYPIAAVWLPVQVLGSIVMTRSDVI